MKTITQLKRIFAIALVAIMLTLCLPTSLFAAKEMFTTYRIDDVTIVGIDAPVAGKKFDFTAEENSQKYNIVKVVWKEYSGNNYITSSSATASAGNKYSVYVVLEVASAEHYFSTGEGRVSAVSSVTVNGNTANANNIQDTTLFAVDASKYEHDTTYQKYLTVIYTFPTVEAAPIESIEFGIPELVPGERVPTVFNASGITIDSIDGNANNGQVNVNKLEWSLQDGTTLAGNATFEYGKKYTLELTLGTAYGASFATDPNHLLSQPGKPLPVVDVKMNGKTATVLPTYDSYSNLNVVAACVLDCDKAASINKIELSGIDAPVAGKAPDYTFTGGAGYENNGRNDAYYKDGVCWSEENSSYIINDGTHAFLPGKAYQVDIRIKAKEGYAFATNSSGNVSITATVNGKSASVSGNKNEILVTYVFSATDNIALGKVGVTDIDAPVTGNTPDYDAEYANVSYGPADYDDARTQNGISWYNETDKKTIGTGDKFEAGKTYTAQIMIWADDGYEFQYKSGEIDVAATVNGKGADVTSRNETEATLYYTFPETEEHKCSPKKVEEFKATCTEDGKKAYYFCPECGKNFEDSKCTKEIADINAWGVIEATDHTGGKATCDTRAICKECGEFYGKLAEHSFGTSWDYKDEKGHAHKCKVCGVTDTVVPHKGEAAKCGELSKCVDCKAEFGEVLQHKWSTDWAFTDSKGHAHKCTVCGEHDTIIEHNGGSADCQTKAKCTACATEYGSLGEHKWSTAWDYTSATGHAHKCTVAGCDEHDSIVKHTPGPAATETSEQKCTVCSFVIAPKTNHVHKLIRVEAVNATCTSAGKKQYYYCESCSDLYEDGKGTKLIKDQESLIIPATGHKESKWKSDADTHWKECNVKGCGVIIDGTKLAHEFSKNKCTVCGYKLATKDTEKEEKQTKENEETASEEVSDTKDETDSEVKDEIKQEDSEKAEEITENEETQNIPAWVIIVAIVALLAVALIIVTVVIITKKK